MSSKDRIPSAAFLAALDKELEAVLGNGYHIVIESKFTGAADLPPVQVGWNGFGTEYHTCWLTLEEAMRVCCGAKNLVKPNRGQA